MNPSKNQIFQWTPKSLKVSKFLVKVSQFEFLVMIEKNIFVYQLFLSLNIPDFSLFLRKNCNPPKKDHPFFLTNLPLKIKVLSSPLFENLVGGLTFPTLLQKEGVYTMLDDLYFLELF